MTLFPTQEKHMNRWRGLFVFFFFLICSCCKMGGREETVFFVNKGHKNTEKNSCSKDETILF